MTGINTWEDFKAALLAGTLPIDLNGINEAGWQQIGDALNKANLLGDTTCDLLQLATTATLNDAFTKLALGTGKYAYKLTVLTPGGRPLVGATIGGLTTITNGTVYTNSDGVAFGVSTSQNPSVTITVADAITARNATMTQLTTTSINNLRFSSDVDKVYMSLCGAGGTSGNGNGGNGHGLTPGSYSPNHASSGSSATQTMLYPTTRYTGGGGGGGGCSSSSIDVRFQSGALGGAGAAGFRWDFKANV